tara:strand:+ start:83 stop:1075 length:993 start_codon:yes stop_codon:yes gene_type:complete
VTIKKIGFFGNLGEKKYPFYNIMDTFYSSKSYFIYSCEKCDYNTRYKKDFTKHLSTRKHLRETNGNIFVPKPALKCTICDRQFQNRSGLWKHRKKCVSNPESQSQVAKNAVKEEIGKLDIGTVNELIKQNKELLTLLVEQKGQIDEQKLMLDEIKNKQENIVINNTQNNYNIQMFLKEKCKDAINFTDFIEKIEVSYDDLENNAELGFVNGMTKILIDNLRQLTLYERPIHCTDVKRETLYIKDQDTWFKEQDAQKLRDGIREVSRKSIGSLIQWKKTNPDYQDMDSEFSNKCIIMQRQSTSFDNYPQISKVIHNIAKENAIKINKLTSH